MRSDNLPNGISCGKPHDPIRSTARALLRAGSAQPHPRRQPSSPRTRCGAPRHAARARTTRARRRLRGNRRGTRMIKGPAPPRAAPPSRGQHPTGQHPTGQHPTGQHPQAEDPTGQHPNFIVRSKGGAGGRGSAIEEAAGQVPAAPDPAQQAPHRPAPPRCGPRGPAGATGGGAVPGGGDGAHGGAVQAGLLVVLLPLPLQPHPHPTPPHPTPRLAASVRFLSWTGTLSGRIQSTATMRSIPRPGTAIAFRRKFPGPHATTSRVWSSWEVLARCGKRAGSWEVLAGCTP